MGQRKPVDSAELFSILDCEEGQCNDWGMEGRADGGCSSSQGEEGSAELCTV